MHSPATRSNPQDTIAIAGFVVVFLAASWAFFIWERFDMTPLEAFWALVS